MGGSEKGASIIVWVVNNEGGGQYESKALAQWVKAIDPSRLTNSNSGWLDVNAGEMFDIHTYEPVPLEPARKSDRAIVIGEYGGGGGAGVGHPWDPAGGACGGQDDRGQAT